MAMVCGQVGSRRACGFPPTRACRSRREDLLNFGVHRVLFMDATRRGGPRTPPGSSPSGSPRSGAGRRHAHPARWAARGGRIRSRCCTERRGNCLGQRPRDGPWRRSDDGCVLGSAATNERGKRTRWIEEVRADEAEMLARAKRNDEYGKRRRKEERDETKEREEEERRIEATARVYV